MKTINEKNEYTLRATPIIVVTPDNSNHSSSVKANVKHRLHSTQKPKICLASPRRTALPLRVLYPTRYQTEATAEFVAPLLRFSRPDFHFNYVWDPEMPMAPSSEILEMTNTGQLPLDFTVRTQVSARGKPRGRERGRGRLTTQISNTIRSTSLTAPPRGYREKVPH